MAVNPGKGPDKSARLTRNVDIFRLEPAGSSAVTILIGIALFCDALAIFILVTGGFNIGAMIGVLTLFAVSGLFFWFAFAQRNSSVVVTDRDLRLQIPVYGRRILLEKINSNQIRTINNLPASPYQLSWRLNGLGVPGYHLGWFSSHGKGRILASVTTPRVLVIPTNDKYTLLLSTPEPEGLTRRLRALK